MYGHASVHSSPQLRHKCRALQQSATLSGKGFSRRSESQPCTRMLIFLHSIRRNKKMTCCRVEMCVENTGKQNRCQTTWHFCSGNTNLAWQYELNTPPSQTASRQAAPPGWLHPTPPPHFLSLTSWQPALATSTRAVPFLAHCLHRHLTADDQMGTWEIYSNFYYMEHCQER